MIEFLVLTATGSYKTLIRAIDIIEVREGTDGKALIRTSARVNAEGGFLKVNDPYDDAKALVLDKLKYNSLKKDGQA